MSRPAIFPPAPESGPEHRNAIRPPSVDGVVSEDVPAVEQADLTAQHVTSRASDEIPADVPRGRVTLLRAALAKCADCSAQYFDGRVDCRVPTCSLYRWMPYREGTPDYSWARPKRQVSDEQKAAAATRIRAYHAARRGTQ